MGKNLLPDDGFEGGGELRRTYWKHTKTGGVWKRSGKGGKET